MMAIAIKDKVKYTTIFIVVWVVLFMAINYAFDLFWRWCGCVEAA